MVTGDSIRVPHRSPGPSPLHSWDVSEKHPTAGKASFPEVSSPEAYNTSPQVAPTRSVYNISSWYF